jgi:hypothetical protein
MKSQVTLLAAAAVLVGGAGYASAAPAKPKPVKPVCNLVQDAKGDANISGAVPGTDGDDIVGGDIASDGTSITAVVRMAAIPAADPASPNGRSYIFDFSVPGSESGLFLSARTHPTGTTFVFGYSGVDPTTTLNTSYSLGSATGVVDAAKGEVRVTAPIKGFVDGAKVAMANGTTLKGLGVRVFRQASQTLVPSQQVGPARAPLSGLNVLLDDAAGGSYVMGTPSCVAVGK